MFTYKDRSTRLLTEKLDREREGGGGHCRSLYFHVVTTTFGVPSASRRAMHASPSMHRGAPPPLTLSSSFRLGCLSKWLISVRISRSNSIGRLSRRAIASFLPYSELQSISFIASKHSTRRRFMHHGGKQTSTMRDIKCYHDNCLKLFH